ncbi:MAG: sigma-E processing peptidase SpoIIGA [Bacilli bacterium]
MKIYLDYVFLINFLFDFILLLGISIILKRNVSKLRFILGSVFGGFSFFIIFLNVSSLSFFLIKMFLGLLMVIITFSYKNLKYTLNNFIYLIILSVLMGGILYLTNIEFGYSHVGMLFFTNGKSLNLIILIFLGLLMILIYAKIVRKVKRESTKFFKTTLFIYNKEIKLTGYLDTGNSLMYFNKPVVILNKNISINVSDKKIYYVPFTTINGNGVMKCIKLDKIFVEDKGFFENVFLALSNDKFHLGGADIILNVNLFKEGDTYE